MGDAFFKVMFLVVYAALMFAAFHVVRGFVCLFPEQFWYVASPIIVGGCLVGVAWHEWNYRWRGRSKRKVK